MGAAAGRAARVITRDDDRCPCAKGYADNRRMHRYRDLLRAVVAATVLAVVAAGTQAANCNDRSGGYVLPKVAESDTVIVFVHGLAGDAWETWRDADAAQSWPCQLRLDPAFEKANLYLYGYETGLLGDQPPILKVAGELARALRPVLDAHRQVIFIVHSMGGLVTAEALMLLGSEHRHADLMRRVQLVMFYGTPGSGSALASAARRAELRLQLAELAAGSRVIDSIVQRWGESRRLQDVSRCFAEERAPGGWLVRKLSAMAMTLLGSEGGVIVDAPSAKAPCGGRGLTLDATDHFSLVKPASRPTQHPAYRQLSIHAASCIRPIQAGGRTASLAGKPAAAAASEWRLRLATTQALPPGAEREAALTALLARGLDGSDTADRFVVPRDPRADAPPAYRRGLLDRRGFLQWLFDQPLATREQRQIDITTAAQAGAIVFDGLTRERIDALLADGALLDDDHLVLVDSPTDENQMLLLLLAGGGDPVTRLKGFLTIDARPGCDH